MAQVTFRAATPRDDTLVVEHFTNMMLAMKIPTKDYIPDKYSTDNPALHCYSFAAASGQRLLCCS